MDINAHTLQELGHDLYKITKPGDLTIPEYILCFFMHVTLKEYGENCIR